MLCLFMITWLVLIGQNHVVEAAGMEIHSIVGRRALDYYGGITNTYTPIASDLTTLLSNNQDAVEGGSVSFLLFRATLQYLVHHSHISLFSCL